MNNEESNMRVGTKGNWLPFSDLNSLNKALNVHSLMGYFIYTQVQIRTFHSRKISIIFLPINLNMCSGCSKEPSH